MLIRVIRGPSSSLFLVAACEQLRIFGVYEKVTHYLTHELPGTVRSLFRHLLSNLEKENGEDLVEFILSALTISVRAPPLYLDYASFLVMGCF